ncbi:iron chelate uptake ABC transporter family permease subunit, partial [Enterococcus faecalis]|nr:iron chelate uptake ABC transporter family permease subunit [Enterococcus faecalis]
VAVLINCGILCRESYRLDVLHLGNHQAQNLGIVVNQFQLVLFCLISSMEGLSTELGGMITI